MWPLLIGVALAYGGYRLWKGTAVHAPTLVPGGYYKFIVRAQIGALSSDPNALPEVGVLLGSMYLIQVDQLDPDANDPSVYHGTGHYTGHGAMVATDTLQIKWISIVSLTS